ncbi:conjugal transfer protein TraL [Janthinobacterium sp. HLX7-2]|uniref:PRK13886 family protein n=1 Tax=Janthinobacterium sp. HLX7-2 TaxID=1259331 RepID=UPI003F2615D2
MAHIHMMLQGKGGVGKSLIAAVLAQYMLSKARMPLCIDTDPVNATFHGYQALQVRRIELMEDNEIDPRGFDALIDLVAQEHGDTIIDNGASSFVPLSHYLISNQIPALLKELGHELIVHTVITGGQALLDTISGFAHIASQFPAETRFIAWLNPYWGPVEYEGNGFEQMKTYLANKERLSAIVRLPVLKKETFGRDLADMLQHRLTFDEALAQESLSIMTRQRLGIIRRLVYGELDAAMVL